MKRWKRAEKRVAEIVGGRRVGITGNATEDISHPLLSIEVKSRERLPDWLWDALNQATTNAPQGKFPCAILHQKYSKKRIVLMDLDIFLQIIKGL